MGAPLFPYATPSPTRVVTSWLTTAFGAGNVGARRVSGGPLPFRMVTVVARPETSDRVQERPVVSVHTFADSMDDAEWQSGITHQRMLQLGPPIAAPQPVTITFPDSSTQTVEIQSISTVQKPIWLDYEVDQTIFRFVARYELFLGIQPAAATT